MGIAYTITGALILFIGFKIGKGEKIDIPIIGKKNKKTELTPEEEKRREGWTNIMAHMNRHSIRGDKG
jgi:hypothetical protein